MFIREQKVNKNVNLRILSFFFFLSGFFFFGCEAGIDDKISNLKISIDSIETVIAKEKASLKSNSQIKNIQKNIANQNNGNFSLNVNNEQ